MLKRAELSRVAELIAMTPHDLRVVPGIGQVTFDEEITESQGESGDFELLSRVDTEFAAGELPMNFELRGHYNRLMVNVGIEPAFNMASEEDGWVEYYQLGKNKDDGRAVDGPCSFTTIDNNSDGEADTDSDGNVLVESDCGREILNERLLNRNLYFGSAVVLGRNAGLGFGPRIGFRVGWKNIPHGVQPTLNLGWALQPPIPEGGDRVRPLIDIDLRGGVIVSTESSLSIPSGESYAVNPLFGFTVGVGLTF